MDKVVVETNQVNCDAPVRESADRATKLAVFTRSWTPTIRLIKLPLGSACDEQFKTQEEAKNNIFPERKSLVRLRLHLAGSLQLWNNQSTGRLTIISSRFDWIVKSPNIKRHRLYYAAQQQLCKSRQLSAILSRSSMTFGRDWNIDPL